MVILATSATDQGPNLVSGDIGKMDGKLGGSAHSFRTAFAGDRNRTRDDCPRACGVLSMKATTRLILGSDREPQAQIQARFTSEWINNLSDLIILMFMP